MVWQIATTPRTPPRIDLEAALVRIWQEVLGVDEVGVHDDFFQLGGHSVLGATVLGLLRDRLGVTVELGEFFLNSTVADLAALLLDDTEDPSGR